MFERKCGVGYLKKAGHNPEGELDITSVSSILEHTAADGDADNRIIAKNIIDRKHSLAYLDIFLYLCNLNSFLIV